MQITRKNKNRNCTLLVSDSFKKASMALSEWKPIQKCSEQVCHGKTWELCASVVWSWLAKFLSPHIELYLQKIGQFFYPHKDRVRQGHKDNLCEPRVELLFLSTQTSEHTVALWRGKTSLCWPQKPRAKSSHLKTNAYSNIFIT